MKRETVFFFISLLLLSLGCKKDDNSTNPAITQNTITISPATVVASTTLENSIVSVDSARLVFTKSAEALQLKTGDILVIKKGEGALRKITSVVTDSSQIRIFTTNAKLDDVILDGEFVSQIMLTPMNLTDVTFSDNKMSLTKTLSEFNIAYNNIVVGASQGSSVTIDGYSKFAAPKIMLKVRYKNGIDSMSASIGINHEARYKLRADGKIKVGGTISPPWGVFTFAPVIVNVGFLPVLITPKFKLVFGVTGEVTGAVDASFDVSTEIVAGVRYKNNTFSGFSSFSQNHSNQAIGIAPKGAIEGSIMIPKLGFYIYSLAGPFIDLKLYGSVRDISQTTAGLYWGIKAEGGLETDILGGINGIPQVQWKTEIVKFENQIATIGTPLPPSAPSPSLPLNLATGQSFTPTLSWTSSSTAASYTLQVSTSSSFGSFIYNQEGLTGTVQQMPVLSGNTKYYWRVNATNNSGTSAWSEVYSFTTMPAVPAAPLLSAPTSGSTGIAVQPTLSWNASSDAVSYTLQVSTSSSFSSYSYNQSGLTTTSQQLPALANSTRYYWRVYAVNGTGTSSASSTWYFNTATATVGSISGYIKDATNSTGLSGASVVLKLNSTTIGSMNSSSSGYYSFTGLSAGTYTLTVTKANYITGSYSVPLIAGDNKTFDVPLSMQSSDVQYRIVLTWNYYPRDLDAHLYKGSYHIYWNNRGAATLPPYANLDVDDTTGYGPETMTITKLDNDLCNYFIFNYSGYNNSDIDIKLSQAQVKIYSGSSLLKSYSVPSTGTGYYWYVFDISPSGVISDKNYITNTSPVANLPVQRKGNNTR